MRNKSKGVVNLQKIITTKNSGDIEKARLEFNLIQR